MPETEKYNQAKELMKQGYGVGRAAQAVGLSIWKLRCYINPDYKRHRAVQVRERRLRQDDFTVPIPWKQKYATGEYSRTTSIHYAQRPRDIPEYILAERDRVENSDLTLSQFYFGDPKPGRSALDKKRGITA